MCHAVVRANRKGITQASGARPSATGDDLAIHPDRAAPEPYRVIDFDVMKLLVEGDIPVSFGHGVRSSHESSGLKPPPSRFSVRISRILPLRGIGILTRGRTERRSL